MAMKRGRFSEEQIVGILKEHEAGRKIAELSREHGISEATLYGWKPGERREIERGLRDGTIRGVVATNALELGIDIGSLDACVMAGYGGSIGSLWQGAGRGRRARRTCAR